MQRQFKGVWIPREIWLNEKLTMIEKHLIAEIDSFTRSGECFATNAHFADFFNVSKRQVQRHLESLKEKGFIIVDITYKENSKLVEKRTIRPNYQKIYVDPHDKNDVTPRTKRRDPHDKNDVTPHVENDVGNNTCINNTINNTKNFKKTNKKDSLSSAQLENEFETIWKLYPRKIGKKKAFDSYKKARKTKKVPYEEIENGLYKYLRHIERNEIEDRFIQHGSTWFNQEKWQDEYTTVTPMRKPKNAMEYFKRQYGGNSDGASRNGEIIDHYPTVLPDPF